MTYEFDPATMPLDAFLATGRSPLGTIRVAGGDLAAIIAAERDIAVLRKAATRAAATSDRCWQIAIAERLMSLSYHEQDAASLCGWLIEADRIDAAQRLFDRMARPGPARKDLTLRLGARIALARGAFAEVADTVMDGPFDLARTVDAGWAFLMGGDWPSLRDVMVRARTEAPLDDAVLMLDLRCRSLFDGPSAALATLAGDLGRVRHGTTVHTELTAQILNEMGRFSEALDLIEPAIIKQPTAWSLYGLAESLAAQSDRFDTLERILERAMRLFPDQPQILARAVNLAADTARMDAAASLLPRLHTVSEWGWHEARIGVLCQAGDRAAIDAAYHEAKVAGLPAGAAELGIAGYHYFFRADGDGLARAESLMAPLARFFMHDSGYQCLRLRLMLAQGRQGEALETYAGLPRGLASASQLAPFQFLADARTGQESAARGGWALHLARSGHVSLNAQSALPEAVAVQWDGGKDDILLFAVMFNGIEFVDWFLNHYRNLGVDHFFIVDNGSTDGTFEILRRQPDVSLFRQTDSFRTAGCGIFWINHLIRRFGVGHWCLQVDMDEAFVFPNMERGRSLRDFLGFLTARGWASVPAIMLDIYPEVLTDSPGANSFAASRYFDTDYHAFPNEIPPYQFIQGGIRARMSGRSLMMTKAPLVRPTTDFAFLANNHQHTHLPVSEVSGALLHYKFVGNLRLRVDEAIEREEHFMGARFYRALRDPLAGSGEDLPLLSEFSRVYESPQDLIREGLMISSQDWDDWASD